MTMSAGLTVAVVIAAGAGLVLQNLLMVHIWGLTSTRYAPLLVNSAVGFVLLISITLAQDGPESLAKLTVIARPWFIVPGLLGTFFVFGSMQGYARLGAAPTIALLVSSQLTIGLALDGAHVAPGSSIIGLHNVIGAALLIAGAVLVMIR